MRNFNKIKYNINIWKKMYYLNYKEVNLKYIYSSSLRKIWIKQNLLINNSYELNMPKIQLNFIFNKIVDINILKLSNHIMFLWLLTGKKSIVKKMKNRLERGIRYNSLVIFNEIKDDNIIFSLFDFLLNTFFYLVNKIFFKSFKNFNDFFVKIKSLDIFSNMKLSSNFYTGKVNDLFLMRFFFEKKINFLKIDYFLKNFKFK